MSNSKINDLKLLFNLIGNSIPITRSINTTSYLSGGGTLDKDLILGLSQDTINKIGSALTLNEVGLLAYKNKISVIDLDTPTMGVYGQYLQQGPNSTLQWVTLVLPDNVPSIRKINTSSYLLGGGDLSLDRTLDLSATTKSSLSKADSAIQPGIISTYSTTYNLPGTFTFTVPANVTKLKVRIWGSGGPSGGGSSGLLNSATGSDGGGGGYIEAYMIVSSRWIMTIQVGDGSSSIASSRVSSIIDPNGKRVLANGGDKGQNSTGGVAATTTSLGGTTSIDAPHTLIFAQQGTPGRSGVDMDNSNFTSTGAGFGFTGQNNYYPSGSYKGLASTTPSVGAEGSAGASNTGSSGGNGLIIIEWIV